MKAAQLEVRKDNLSDTEVVETEIDGIEDGQILCKVDRFALTANNITYGVVGEKIGYWQFFPATEGRGVIPVWGFADVVESKHPDVESGERLYGYFPMATHIVLQPDKVSGQRLLDAMPHRRKLPPVYNSYARTGGEQYYDPTMDDERMLLFPLYATSFCLYDYFNDNDYFGASQVIVPSASSKTAIGLAYALKSDPDSPASVGVTSSGNESAVSQLGLYDTVCTYDTLTDIDNSVPSVIIDMSGNGTVLSNLHEHLGDNMRFTSNVGLTHLDDNEMGPSFIRERSEMFFAPGHIQKRAADWGPGVFEGKAMKFWHDAATKSRSWLAFDQYSGMDALEDVYQQLLAGRVSPDRGVIVSMA
ncbi:MAG: DUF2855 family protein [Woeseiaceae bacterium]|nr:DUF2855 family protein [Woeseiaceae bacterium]